jgi:hypothetical protein
MKNLIVLLLLVGCGGRQYKVGNRVEVRVSAAYSAYDKTQFTAKVAEAAVNWHRALPSCKAPFPLQGDGTPTVVMLIPPAEWGYGAGSIGFTPTQDFVAVKGPVPGQPLGFIVDIVTHEFGHIVGLLHTNDETSIMGTRSVTVLNSYDTRKAKEKLAGGVCKAAP